MTSKVIEGHKNSLNFSINPTLPNTFIYELILIKNYMNANIMNTQIFHLNNYDKFKIILESFVFIKKLSFLFY